ncbi:uncharacterized protein SETTUDRAFT_162103 [Exserohilum turcica Et28A]|uniref:Uncharacterized protein n=1 Tax=Exserohilum turcicum (strain 28A) TaxID=671987 RepID=R0J3Q3_EXST2|nr:uncharacterized protein SETTUDRAFT_162103 [Exserohilum turcica Et28A]EOA91366.1 hypothetical protein SETTUDRAFT_162103 [Exserohilum turcica Et28A]
MSRQPTTISAVCLMHSKNDGCYSRTTSRRRGLPPTRQLSVRKCLSLSLFCARKT